MSVRRVASVAAILPALALASCGDEDGLPAGGPASVMPAGAPIYLEATVDPDESQRAEVEALIDKLGSLPILGSPLDPGDLVERAFDELSAESGVETSFAEDVEPWLGERAGLAIGSLDQAEEDFVLAVETTDDDVAQATIERLAAGDDEPDPAAEYQGVSYLKDADGDFAAGVFDGFLVLAGGDRFEAAVDASESDDSLEDSASLSDAFERLDPDAIGRIYVDLGDVPNEALADDPGDSPDDIEAARTAVPEFFEEPLAASLDLNAEGLVLDVAVSAGDDPSAPAQSDLLEDAPANAVVALGIDDPASLVADLVERVERTGDAVDDPVVGEGAIAAAIEARFGLSLEDALAEFGDAVAHFRGDPGGAGAAGVEIALNAEAGDEAPSAALRLLDQLRGVLEADGFKLGPPLNREGPGFSAELSSPDSGPLVLINAEIGADRVSLSYTTLFEEVEAAADSSLGSTAEFGDALTALGDEFEPLAFADPAAILGSFLDDSSVLDVVTGEASPEDALPRFLADKLAYATAGTRVEGDRLIIRLLVAVD